MTHCCLLELKRVCDCLPPAVCIWCHLFALCGAEKCLSCTAALAAEELGFERFHALIHGREEERDQLTSSCRTLHSAGVEHATQITEAARHLASDPSVSKTLKKRWKPSYLNPLKKLQELENAVNENRIKSGKKSTQRASLIIDDGNIGSEDSSLSDALVLEDGGGKSKINVLVSITVSMPIHAVPKGTAAKSTAPGHDEHQILHTGRGLLIQAYFCRSSKDSLQRKLTPATRQSSSRRLDDFHP
ncbi:FERM domain-containing protein 4A-like [Molossus nigricans]